MLSRQCNFKVFLLSSISTAALVASFSVAAQAQASLPGTYVSLEGGSACGFGDTIGFPTGPLPFLGPSGGVTPANFINNTSSIAAGSDGCGWTGRIGYMSSGSGILGFGSAWGIFVRHSDFEDSDSGSVRVNSQYVAGGYYPNNAGNGTGEYEEQRTVVDFEIGQDLGIGGSSEAQVSAGLRYARFMSETDIQTGPLVGSNRVYTATIDSESRFNGIGPRIGIKTRVPINSMIAIKFAGSGSVLFGRQRVETTTFTTGFNNALTRTALLSTFQESKTTWVGNIEGEAALSFLPFGDNGGQLDIGVRAEGWFRQGSDYAEAIGGSNDLNRHNFGPFARYMIRIGGP